MGTLIRFELRKILGNRAGMAACVLALALVAAIFLLNLLTYGMRDYFTGEYVEGLQAQEANRALVETHAGVLDDAHVAADAAELDRANELIAQTEDFYDKDSEQIIKEYGLEFWQQTLGVANQRYYMEIVGTLDSHNPRATSLEVGAKDRIEAALVAGMNGNHPYSDAAKEYWRSKAANIAWPAEFGYAEGWKSALSWQSFLALVIVAACIAISGVFAGEYQGGTAAVVLPTKRGKRTLPAAKVIASLIFVTCFWWLSVAVGVGINMAMLGPGGLELPVQIIFGYDNPYPLTVGQVAVLVYGLGWLVSLGMAAFTLWLSAKMRSTMPVAVAPLAIMFLGLLGLFSSLTDRIAALTPLSVLDYSFSRMVSYDVGSLVVDLPTLAAILYALALVVLAPLAMRAFRRHQVA